MILYIIRVLLNYFILSFNNAIIKIKLLTSKINYLTRLNRNLIFTINI